MKLSGWGRYPVLETELHRPRSVEALRALVLSGPGLIARGNGRASGDSAIGSPATVGKLPLPVRSTVMRRSLPV